MSWILILSLYAEGYKAGGPTIESMAGFQTEQACMVAANTWLKQARTMPNTISARALCVPVGVPVSPWRVK